MGEREVACPRRPPVVRSRKTSLLQPRPSHSLADNSPLPTRRLEALRDGLEDAAYMALLRGRIETARKMTPERDLSSEAALLNGEARTMHDAKSWEALLEWRKRMAAAILSFPSSPASREGR